MDKKSIFWAIAIVSLISLVANYFDLARGWEIYLSGLLSFAGFYFLEHFIGYVDHQKKYDVPEPESAAPTKKEEMKAKNAA